MPNTLLHDEKKEQDTADDMMRNEKEHKSVRRGGAGNFANDRKRAVEAGRKGGRSRGRR